MVDIRLRELTKRFGQTVAVDHVSLYIAEGELFTLLGPSGCGKTTTLRCVAGFCTPDGGEIFFGEKLVNPIPSFKRNTGMVFQNYALWPHMTVFENIAYGLKIRRMPRGELKDKVADVLELTHLEGLEDRWPSQLSGGQQQRVALARALVIEPDVLLLDEPLSNLDAKLRVEMRIEIKRIQKRLKTTTIYVTHDQEEALSISDKLVVMNQGRTQQVGAPRQVYESPENQFVADFIGIANFIEGIVSEIDGKKLLAFVETEQGFGIEAMLEEGITGNMKVLASVRPEALSVYRRGQVPSGMNRIDGVVRLTTYLGDVVRYEVETPWGATIRADVYNPRHAHIFREKEEVSLAFKGEDTKLIRL
ncbi:MAG: ABC transporter ATP-binding protein [Candidatus Bathyarchaeota archaeon]|nr:ABC transporter ATP-binding protein [Candidatus Bathyarchaeota archaeon]